jgi:hypothetical protein
MPPVDERDAAQAAELVRALCDELRKMAAQAAWLERQDITARNGRAFAMRTELAALHRDIHEAQAHVDHLRQRYLSPAKNPEPTA